MLPSRRRRAHSSRRARLRRRGSGRSQRPARVRLADVAATSRALSAEFGSYGRRRRDASRDKTQVKTFGVFNEKKGSGKKKGLALPPTRSRRRRWRARARARARAREGQGRRARRRRRRRRPRASPTAPSSTPARGPGRALGAAPFAVLPVWGWSARAAPPRVKQREAEQQAAIRARQAQELTPLQQKADLRAAGRRRGVARRPVRGRAHYGRGEARAAGKGKKAGTSAKGPSCLYRSSEAWNYPSRRARQDLSEARAAAQPGPGQGGAQPRPKKAAAQAKQDAADAKAAKIAERKAAKADASAAKADATASAEDAVRLTRPPRPRTRRPPWPRRRSRPTPRRRQRSRGEGRRRRAEGQGGGSQGVCEAGRRAEGRGREGVGEERRVEKAEAAKAAKAQGGREKSSSREGRGSQES